MIGFSELIVILIIVFIIFGAGRIPSMMNEVAKGIKAFQQGMMDEGGKKKSSKDISNIKKNKL